MSEMVVVALIAGVTGMVPGIITGWLVWRKDYRATRDQARETARDELVDAHRLDLEATAARREALDDREQEFNTRMDAAYAALQARSDARSAENRKRIENLEAVMRSQAEQIVTLTLQNREQAADMKRLHQENDQLRAEVEQMANQLTVVKAENQRLKNENGELRQQVVALSARVDQQTNGGLR